MASSGLALAAQDADLVTYAKNRQPLFDLHEAHLAELICYVASSAPGNPPGLLALAEDMNLRVAWPEPSLDLPGPDRDNADLFEITYELTDTIELLMKRRGLTEQEAIAECRKIARRKAIAAAIASDPEADVAPLLPAEPASDVQAGEGVDGEVVTPDMGVPGGVKPSDRAAPAESITPSITATVVVPPSEPIPLDPQYLAPVSTSWDRES